jgi:hypothetical protein
VLTGIQMKKSQAYWRFETFCNLSKKLQEFCLLFRNSSQTQVLIRVPFFFQTLLILFKQNNEKGIINFKQEKKNKIDSSYSKVY